MPGNDKARQGLGQPRGGLELGVEADQRKVELSGPPALRLGFSELVPYQYDGACRVRLPFAWVLVSWVPTSMVAFIGCQGCPSSW